jgi:hypothetical protein
MIPSSALPPATQAFVADTAATPNRESPAGGIYPAAGRHAVPFQRRIVFWTSVLYPIAQALRADPAATPVRK